MYVCEIVIVPFQDLKCLLTVTSSVHVPTHTRNRIQVTVAIFVYIMHTFFNLHFYIPTFRK